LLEMFFMTVKFGIGPDLSIQFEMLQLQILHCAKSYRPFELFVNENYKL